MNPIILRDGPVDPQEIEDLRSAVGWDRCEGTYEHILQRHYAYYTARTGDGKLVGYMSVLSDGIADAFLLDLMVHPEHRKNGLGSYPFFPCMRFCRCVACAANAPTRLQPGLPPRRITLD